MLTFLKVTKPNLEGLRIFFILALIIPTYE